MAPPDDTGSGDDVSAAIGIEAAMAALQAENAVLRSENAALIGPDPTVTLVAKSGRR